VEVGDAAAQRIAPFIHLLVRERHRVHAVGGHEGVGLARRAVDIKLFFEEQVYGRVQTERRPGRLAHAEAPVKVETARALHKQLYLGPAQAVRLMLIFVVEIPRTLGVVELRHAVFDRIVLSSAANKKRPHFETSTRRTFFIFFLRKERKNFFSVMPKKTFSSSLPISSKNGILAVFELL